MKKRMLLLLLALVLGLQICASAVEPKYLTVTPSISFSGSTATCSVYVEETDDNAYIVVTMKLWADNRVLQTWTKTGLGEVELIRTASATKGETYTLEVSVMVNGISKPTRSVTKTY